MGSWPLRRWAVAVAVALLAAIVIGVPTGVVPSPFYTRMTPVLWWNYPVWIVSSVLEGLLVSTYVRVGPRPAVAQAPEERPVTARALGAGLLSAFAVGCPICNKLVVLAIGVSGALSLWAPLQPVLALGSVGLLLYALVRRLRTAEKCPVPA
ncbi:hypothetical protein Q5762_26810 [Streptomyces sp. P9(2023)]|uniref:hypothetical protein n=1 Tax=Streptomyces sp. P9(2023) TaxID=3064394 RepID=UPI0028F40E79|nr:hypothetical protein [Streptomyces sp. P9(2023)]MDT9691879.1 hypothetical protein [Streptomyces sp. P9(2023)]